MAEIDEKETDRNRGASLNQGMVWGWVLSFIATIHLLFLLSILPHVLEGFGLTEGNALKAAGSNLLTFYAVISAATVGAVVAYWITTPKTLHDQARATRSS